jgi:multiple sugar transport system permease protein
MSAKSWALPLNTALVAVLALPFVVPFVWLITTAFKTDVDIFRLSFSVLPQPITIANFARIMTEFPFLLYLRNTTIVAVGSVLGAVLGSMPVAYSLTQLEWPDRKYVFSLLLITMMLPAQVTMIPVFLIYRHLGWVNTFLPLLVPCFLGNAFFVFLLRQFLAGFPASLVESARIDGAGEPRIMTAILMPLCKPALITVILFAGMGAWNDFFTPLIYLADDNLKTLALGLQNLVGQHGSQWGMLMAGSVLMALPVVLLFCVAQRYFIEGIALSGVKG